MSQVCGIVEVVLDKQVQPAHAASAIRVFIADAQQVVRDGICQTIARTPDIQLVGESASGIEAVTLTRSIRPDVVILDMHLGETNGVEVTRLLRQVTTPARSPESTPNPPEILVYSAHTDKQYIWSFLAAGARGYLLKNEPLSLLMDGIRLVAAGQTILSHEIQTKLVALMPKLNQDLSDSERRVLRLLARGMSNAEIAHLLQISEGTVKSHISNTYRKIPWIHSRAEAVAWAWINRIVGE